MSRTMKIKLNKNITPRPSYLPFLNFLGCTNNVFGYVDVSILAVIDHGCPARSDDTWRLHTGISDTATSRHLSVCNVTIDGTNARRLISISAH